MRSKSIFLLALALGCGLVAMIGIMQVLNRPAPEQAPPGESAVVVATQGIGVGDPIKREMVRLEPWPKEKIPANALTNLEDIDGRRPRTSLCEGVPILESQLLEKDADAYGPSLAIPKGYRVVPVKIDPVVGSVNMLRPGDHVNVLVHMSNRFGRGDPQNGHRDNSPGHQGLRHR